MSSRSLFIPVGMKLDHFLRFAVIMKELHIDTSPDIFGVPANACFVLLNYRFTEVRNPQAYTTATSDPCHMTCPHCSPGKDKTAVVCTDVLGSSSNADHVPDPQLFQKEPCGLADRCLSFGCLGLPHGQGATGWFLSGSCHKAMQLPYAKLCCHVPNSVEEKEKEEEENEKKRKKEKEKPPDKLCHLLRIVLEMETCETRAKEGSHDYLPGGKGVSLLYFSQVWLLMQEICGFRFFSLW